MLRMLAASSVRMARCLVIRTRCASRTERQIHKREAVVVSNKKWGVFLVVFSLFFLVATHGVEAQQAALSKDLVGEWSGEVRAPGTGIITSHYYLTIDEVKDGKFRGRLLVTPSRVMKTEESVDGTFNGSMLQFTAGSGRKAELTLKDGKLIGRGFGTVWFDVSLDKKRL
jgi:hypothetical protein